MSGYDKATLDHIVGRVVGDLGDHIAVATATRERTGEQFVLAVRTDGTEYVTWQIQHDEMTGRVHAFWGHYHGADFAEACADLERRASA